MGNFFALVSIENKKLWKRLATKVMLIILLAIIIAATSIYKYYDSSQHKSNSNTTNTSMTWKEEYQKDLIEQKASLEKLQKQDNKMMKTQIGGFKKNIAEIEYRLNNNIEPESQRSIWNLVVYFDSNASYAQLIALFLIIACAAVIAGEFSEGTMKMMICRPYKRFEILTAKLSAVLIYGIVLIAVTFLANFLLLGIFFGFHGIGQKEMFWTGSKIIYMAGALKTLIVFALDFLQVLAYVVVAFAISAIFRSRSIATGFSLFLLLVGSQILQLLAIFFSWCKFLPFVNTGFSSIVNQGAFFESMTLAPSIGVSIVYSIIFCFAGYLFFIKRDI